MCPCGYSRRRITSINDSRDLLYSNGDFYTQMGSSVLQDMRYLSFIFVLLISTTASACDDINLTPKEFYSIEGRKKCWSILQEGCACRITESDKIFLVQNCPRHNQPENRCNCKTVLMCYDTECIHQEVCDAC